MKGLKMNKQTIVDNLIRIKSLQDALKAEVDLLRQHIALGEKAESPLGSIHNVESTRTTFDEKGIYDDLVSRGIDPSTVGDVVVKVDRKKFANAIMLGEIPSSMVDDYSNTKTVPQLRIKPKADHDQLNKDTMARVASVVEKD